MKIKHSLVFAALLGFAVIGFAQETSAGPIETPKEEKWKKLSHSDRALTFIMDKVEKYSEKAETAIGKAVDVAMQEARPLMEEFLLWRAVQNGFKFALPFSFFLFFIILLFSTAQKGISNFDDRELNKYGFGFVVGCAGSIISLLITLFHTSNLLTFIQIQVAPRVYLLEEVMRLMK